MAPMDGDQLWSQPPIVSWCQLLLDSYRHWTSHELIDRISDAEYQSHALFLAPIVVVSHGVESDPILNYGNQMAQNLWEMTWKELTQTPSRLTAEVVNRAEREWMLEQARTRGHITHYRGVRITRTGRRFLVEQAVVWNVIDPTGQRVGQAASFSEWRFL